MSCGVADCACCSEGQARREGYSAGRQAGFLAGVVGGFALGGFFMLVVWGLAG